MPALAQRQHQQHHPPSLQGNLLQPWSVPDIRLGRSGARDLSVQYATDSLADPGAALGPLRPSNTQS